MSTVLIRQIPDDYAEQTGLAKHNRSRMPGCTDQFAASPNGSRYITGLDEEAVGLSVEEKEKIKTLRESLERKRGYNLAGNSPFWEDFYVAIHSDKPKSFNTENPDDVIALKMLFSNRIVAPDKESAFTPAYREAMYYAFTEENEIKEEISDRRKRDKALVQLSLISENKDKMLLYGQYLEGLKYTSSLGLDSLYKMLRAYIEDKDIKNCGSFLSALDKSVEEIQQKIIIDKALKQRLISKHSVGKKQTYQFGQVTLGGNLEELYKNLSSPDFAPELLALKNEIDK